MQLNQEESDPVESIFNTTTESQWRVQLGPGLKVRSHDNSAFTLQQSIWPCPGLSPWKQNHRTAQTLPKNSYFQSCWSDRIQFIGSSVRERLWNSTLGSYNTKTANLCWCNRVMLTLSEAPPERRTAPRVLRQHHQRSSPWFRPSGAPGLAGGEQTPVMFVWL